MPQRIVTDAATLVWSEKIESPFGFEPEMRIYFVAGSLTDRCGYAQSPASRICAFRAQTIGAWTSSEAP